MLQFRNLQKLLLFGFLLMSLAVIAVEVLTTPGFQRFSALIISPNDIVSGFRFTYNQAQIAKLNLVVQTVVGDISLGLENISAKYELKEATIHSITIAKAQINLTNFVIPQPEQKTSNAPLSLPALPIQQLNIEKLDLEVDTQWGLINFVGNANALYTQSKSIVLTLENEQELAILELRSHFQQIKLSVTSTAGKVFDLNFKQIDQNISEFHIQANADLFLQWLDNTRYLPDKFKATLQQALSLPSDFDISGMQLDLSAKSQDHLQSVKGRLELTRAQSYVSSAEISIVPKQGKAVLDGHLDLSATELFKLLKPWHPKILANWLISGGNVMGTYRLNWQSNTQTQVALYLKAYQVALQTGPISIEDVYIVFALKDLQKLSMQLDLEIPVLHLGKETTLRNLQIKARQHQQQLLLEQALLPAFGGKVEVLPTSININQQPCHLTLGVNNLDLVEILSQFNIPQLSATGRISGKLPLRLSADSLQVIDGKLKSMHAGVIRYQSPVTKTENIAFKALRNMHYQNLQATLNYHLTRDYQLGLRLEGKNPDLLSGSPIAFNINLTGNLPALLQKGILTGDFEKPILDQVELYGKTHH